MRKTISKCQPSSGNSNKVKERDHRDWNLEQDLWKNKVQGGGEFKHCFLEYLWETTDFICLTHIKEHLLPVRQGVQQSDGDEYDKVLIIVDRLT